MRTKTIFKLNLNRLRGLAVLLIALCSTTQISGAGAVSISTSTVIFPAGSTSPSSNAWSGAGAPTAYSTTATDYTINSSGSWTFYNAADYGNTSGLQLRASSGYIQTVITSSAGVDIEVKYKVGPSSSKYYNLTLSLTGASDVTGKSSSETTMSISTTSTTATFKINKSTAGVAYVKYIKITPKASACTNKVTLTKSSPVNGTFKLHNGSASGTEIASGGTVDNCDANAVVYIVPSPNTGYAVSGKPTATNSTSVTASGSNYYITYTKGSSISSTVTVSFAAQSYTVTLNKNGGTGGTASVSATYDDTCPTIGGTVPTKDGYDFDGYWTGEGGTGTKVVNANLTWVATVSNYTSSGKWVRASATILYAKWTAKTYTVTWKVNGQTYTTGTPSTSVSHDSRVTKLPTAPDPASYCGDKFMGWTTTENYDASSAPSTLFTTASGAPVASGNQVFYAVFGYYEE